MRQGSLATARRSGRAGMPLELSTSRTTAWARLQPAATSCLRWAFQPRAWLSLEHILQGRPGSLIDFYGLAIGASPVQNPGVHRKDVLEFGKSLIAFPSRVIMGTDGVVSNESDEGSSIPQPARLIE